MTIGHRRRRGRAPVVLVYHHIAAAPCRFTDGLNITIDPDTFDHHLRRLARDYDVIAADDLAHPPERAVLITFDDAYRSVPDIAGPLLRARSMPSVFFVIAGAVGGDRLPLDNLLCLARHELGPDRLSSVLGAPVKSTSDAIFGVAARLAPAGIDELRARLCTALGRSEQALRREADLFLAPDDLPRLATLGMEVGNHTSSHAFLRQVPDADLDAEIGDARGRLEQLSGRPVRLLSIPYGDTRDATPAVLAAARRSGHEGVFLVEQLPNDRRPAPDIFYRVSPGSVPARRLATTIDVWPHVRRLRQTLRDRRSGAEPTPVQTAQRSNSAISV